MNKKLIRMLSVIFAMMIALTLSVPALADGEESVAEDVSTIAADVSEVVSKAEEEVSEAVSEAEKEAEDSISTFPWARVITLGVIVILIVVAIILSKTNTKLGQKINKFFKEYISEIKKISWSSPKDTLKATGVVLAFIIGAAVAIGVLDYAFTSLIKLLAKIF